MEKEFCQHGDTTVYEHSVRVATVSLLLARWLRFRVRKRELIRGALLHDYFLYDWHKTKAGHGLHGFTHPKTALNCAREDYLLSRVEENIILRHMFPLVPIPPACREAWIICLADKYCAAAETLGRNRTERGAVKAFRNGGTHEIQLLSRLREKSSRKRNRR